MFYTLTWLLTFGLFAAWSLGAWAFHAVAAWAVANAGLLAGGTAVGSLRLPEWLAPWVPVELVQGLASMLSAFTPAIESLLAWAPALASGLSVLVWVVWALGSALLLALGLALSALIAMINRRTAGASRTPLAA